MSAHDPTKRVFAFLFCSLDGYHEGPGGELGWGLYDEEFFEWNLRQTREVGALLLGRRTYEHFVDAWTTAEAAERMPEVTAFMNAVPKTVVTGGGAVTPLGEHPRQRRHRPGRRGRPAARRGHRRRRDLR